MNKHKLFPLMAILLITILLIAGCSDSSSTSTTSSTTTSTSSTTAASSTTTTTSMTTSTSSPTADDAYKYGGICKISVLRWANSGFGYPPLIGVSANGMEGCYPALESLIKQNDKGEFIPTGLTTAFTLDEDGKSYTLTLRQGVKFHDGTDFNAEAAKWNLETTMDAGTVAGIGNWSSVEAVDEYTLRLHVSQPSAYDIGNLALYAGFICSPTAVKENGAEWASTHPVGTGPFKFKSFTPDVGIQYERFDDYWQEGKPYLDELHFVFIADAMTRSLALQAGEIHVARADDSIAADLDAKGFPSVTAKNNLYVYVPDSANPDSPFYDKRVRLAIDYAINREAICAGLGNGYYHPAYQIALEGYSAYLPDIEPRTYDPDKAKELLAEAGYSDGFDMEITLVTIDDFHTAVQQNLRDIGINCEINVVTGAAFTALNSGGWENSMLNQGIPWREPGLGQVQRYWAQGGNFNYSMWKPDGWNDLIEEGLAQTDPEKLREYTRQCAQIIFDEALIIPLWQKDMARFFTTDVHDTGWYQPGVFFFDWTPAEIWLGDE